MVQYSDDILNLFGSPELSKLTLCGAKELLEWPDYLSVAKWNYMCGVRYRDRAVEHLSIAFLRRGTDSAEEYRAARAYLIEFVEGVQSGRHLLRRYLLALTRFEQCIASIWQAVTLVERMENRILGSICNKPTLYAKGDNSDLERINNIYNVIKHFSARQAEITSTPLWITNEGLKSVGVSLTFDEIHDNITALSNIAREYFSELPRKAVARRNRRTEVTASD